MSPTATSGPSSSRGPDVIKWGLSIERKPPRDHRDDRGELDVERITLDWLGWRCLETGGADMGGVHTVEAGYSRGAMFRPGAGRGRVELDDKAGRHWPPFERQHHTLAKAVETFERAGLFI